MTRILLVDDSEDQQEAYEFLLEGEGHDIAKASDGGAGLCAVVEQRPEVVLLDMMMPDVDGLEFLRRLPLECTAPLPLVIGISGFAPYRDEALRRGAHAFLQKPVELDVLLAAVRAAVAARSIPGDVIERNSRDVAAARTLGSRRSAEIIEGLTAPTLDRIRPRLRALVWWLQRYFGFGAASIQLLRGGALSIEAMYAGTSPSLEGQQFARELMWCDDVIDAGSTLLMEDSFRRADASSRPELKKSPGRRFYAGVPLTTRSGAAIGTLSLVDSEPHVMHTEDMHLVESLGLNVARVLEAMAAGTEDDELVLDADALFAPEMLSALVHMGLQCAERVGGAICVAIIRFADASTVGAATRAAYSGGHLPGLAVVRRSETEIVLVEVGAEEVARNNVAAALAAFRRDVSVPRVGTAWHRFSARSDDSTFPGVFDVGDRLVGLAAASLDGEAHEHDTLGSMTVPR
jgi:CheY-like chemotaxis protein